jgi:hypothetical protein
MNREELSALHAALEAVMAWPDSVRAEVARWLTPNDVAPNGAPGKQDVKENNGEDHTAPNGAPKPNGQDRHPPRPAPSRRAAPLNSRGIVGAGNPGRFAPTSWWS